MKSRLNRLHFLGFLLLATALMVVILSRFLQDGPMKAEKGLASPESKSAPISPRNNPEYNLKSEGREKLRNQTSRFARKAEVDSLESFPEIEQCLSNDHISNEDAARQLAKIALDATRSETERLEAIGHGSNLGFGHLLTLSSNPNLPIPLAESYLHGLHGHDQVKEQVSGALGLLNHVDPDISQQAGILLGFLIGAEEDNESPDRLREKADAFLKQPDEGSEEVSGQ